MLPDCQKYFWHIIKVFLSLIYIKCRLSKTQCFYIFIGMHVLFLLSIQYVWNICYIMVGQYWYNFHIFLCIVHLQQLFVIPTVIKVQMYCGSGLQTERGGGFLQIAPGELAKCCSIHCACAIWPSSTAFVGIHGARICERLRSPGIESGAPYTLKIFHIIIRADSFIGKKTSFCWLL